MAKLSGVTSGMAALALALGAQATVVRELDEPDALRIAAAQLVLEFLTTDAPGNTDKPGAIASPTRSAVVPLPNAAGPSFASHASADPVTHAMAGDDAWRVQPSPGAGRPGAEVLQAEAPLPAHPPGADAAAALPTGEPGSYGFMALAVAASAMLAGIFGAAGVAGVDRLRRR